MAKKKKSKPTSSNAGLYKLSSKDEVKFKKWWAENHKRLDEPKNPNAGSMDWRGVWHSEGKPTPSKPISKPAIKSARKSFEIDEPVKTPEITVPKTGKSRGGVELNPKVEEKILKDPSKGIRSARKGGKAIRKLKSAKVAAKEATDTGMSNIQKLYLAGGILEATSIAIGSMAKASAIKAKGKFEEAGYIENAKRMELAAEDAIKRGNKEAGNHMKGVRKLMGSQRAAMAASGVDIDSGSARDIQLETIELGQEDTATIRTNAFLEAHGYKMQKVELESQAQMSRIDRKGREKATLLSGKLKLVQSAVNTGVAMNKAGSAK